MNKRDYKLILMIIIFIVSLCFIGYLFYYSLNTIEDKDNTIFIYPELVNEWTDSSNNNYLKINNNSTYIWYKDYLVNKDKKESGSIRINRGNSSLTDLDMSFDEIKKLFNIEDIEVEDIYLLKLYTSNKDINYVYYKFITIYRDNELFIYNLNDKVFYYLNHA